MDWHLNDTCHDKNTNDINQFKIFSKFKEKISQIVYRYGLFCSSYPWLAMIISIIVFTIACYPLIKMQLASPSSHQKFVTNSNDVFFDDIKFVLKNVTDSTRMYKQSTQSQLDSMEIPRWFQTDPPFIFIQQILVRSAVVPWQKNLILMDAIRGPLGRVFPLKEFISNRQFLLSNGKSRTLSDYCMQVFEPVSLTVKSNSDSNPSNVETSESLLPRYSCLLISPGNFWHNDEDKFAQDPSILKRLHEIHHEGLLPVVSLGHLREVLFGVPWKETGIRKMYLTTRQRTITYAVTLILTKYDPEFIKSLRDALEQRYPSNPHESSTLKHSMQSHVKPLKPVESSRDNDTLKKTIESNESSHISTSSASTSTHVNHTDSSDDETSNQQNIIHLYFRIKISYNEYILRALMYLLIFSYVLFSVRKIDLIKCKWALALGSVLTGFMTFSMSFGICLWLDLNFVPSKSDVLPYIVSLVGLESMLVLTNSVVSTPAHLDRRVRIAQGLSKEAWPTMKMLLFEVSCILIGYLTYVPVIQEFCLFGFAAVLADIFLQATFFTAILSIDIQRLQIQEKQYLNNTSKLNTPSNGFNCHVNGNRNKYQRVYDQFNFNPSLESHSNTSRGTTNTLHSIQLKLPKRLKFFYFIARTRFVRRTLVVCLVIWISYLLCDSGLSERFPGHSLSSNTLHNNVDSFHKFSWSSDVTDKSASTLSASSSVESSSSSSSASSSASISPSLSPTVSPSLTIHSIDESIDPSTTSPPVSSFTDKLDNEFHLTANHWKSLFSCYNMSLAGKYISILPSIKLIIPINPSDAIRSRHPLESDPQIFRQFLPVASNDLDDDYEDSHTIYEPFPSHPGQIITLVILSLPFLILVFYAVYILYKVCCSRNYAEWRSEWSQVISSLRKLNLTNLQANSSNNSLIFDVLPINSSENLQEIELLATNVDSVYIISSDIQGDLIVWDTCSALSRTIIRRNITRDDKDTSLKASNCISSSREQENHYHVNEIRDATCTHVSGFTSQSLSTFNTPVGEPNLSYSSNTATTVATNAGYNQYIGETRQSDSFSSDSTYGSSPSTCSALSESNLESPSASNIAIASTCVTCTPYIDVKSTASHSSSFSFTGMRSSVNKNRLPTGHRRHHSTSSILSLGPNATSPLSTLNASISPSPGIHYNSSSDKSFPFQDKQGKWHQRQINGDTIASSSAYSVTPAVTCISSGDSLATRITPSTVAKINCNRELLTDLIRSAVHAPKVTASTTTTASSSTSASTVAVNTRSSSPSDKNIKSIVSSNDVGSRVNNVTNTIHSPLPFASIWTLEMYTNRIYVGCENGRVEIWDVPSGTLVYHHENKCEGITGIRVTHCKMFLAHLDGVIEVYQLEPPNSNILATTTIGNQLPYGLIRSLRSHRQPISVMEVTSSHLVTGSLDHLIKVHSIDTGSVVYTLHGHFGAITCIEIDPCNPSTAYTACSTGQISVWDLNTGTCIFSLEGHVNSSVTCIITTPLYFVTLGTDDKILIWDKYTGNLVHKITSHHTFCKNVALLSTNILVTAKESQLVLYDISEGVILRVIDVNSHFNNDYTSTSLTDNNTQQRTNLLPITNGSGILIKNLRISSSSRSVVCDYGSSVCVLHFSQIGQKFD